MSALQECLKALPDLGVPSQKKRTKSTERVCQNDGRIGSAFLKVGQENPPPTRMSPHHAICVRYLIGEPMDLSRSSLINSLPEKRFGPPDVGAIVKSVE
jgi:hypothetical protein